MDTKQFEFVGVDDGHYAVKVVTEDGTMTSIPSRARIGRHMISLRDTSDDGNSGGIYQTDDGGIYTVSEHLTEADNTRFRDYPISALNRVLVHHALRNAGFADKNVSIATGLPVSYYYLGCGRNDTLIDGKVANLKKSVICESGPCARIIENVITTEAIAAYFDQMIEMDGSASADHEESKKVSVGVIDVGGKTTDCAVIMPGGTQVDTNRSGSSDVGLLKLHDAVGDALRSTFKFDQISPALIESAIATGIIRVYGKVESVETIVRNAKKSLADVIMSNVRAKIGTGKDLEWILFVGGGAIVMREQLEGYYPHIRFPDRPEFANARGMLKIAKYVFGQKE